MKIYIAGAGAGKTTLLLQEYLDQLQKIRDVLRIPLVTFTEKMADELLMRLRSNTEISRKFPLIEKAPITTIHAFCRNILQQFPVRSTFNDTILHEVESLLLMDRCVRNTLSSLLMTDSELSGILWKIVEAHEFNFEKVISLMVMALRETRRHTHPKNIKTIFNTVSKDFEKFLLDEINSGSAFTAFTILLAKDFLPLEKAVFEFAEQFLREILAGSIRELKKHHLTPSLTGDLLVDCLEAGRTSIQFRMRNSFYTTMLKEIWQLCKNMGENAQEIVKAAKEKIYGEFLQAKYETALLQYLNNAYDLLKKMLLVSDYDDLLFGVADLLESRTVQDTLRKKYPVIIIDEFQDTNYLQFHILSRIAEKIICAGDPKQAIYRFRGGDVSLYNKIIKKYEVVRIVKNYRSTKALVDFYNRFFAKIFESPQFSFEVGYDPMEAVRENGSPPQFIIIQTPPKAKKEIRRILEAEAIAKTLQKMPAPGNCAILLRSTRDMEYFAGALQRYGIPFRTVASRHFYTSREIADAIALLQLVANPTRENLVRVLCSMIIRLPASEILAWYYETKGSFQPGSNPRIQRIFTLVEKYRAQTDIVPHSILVYNLLEEAGFFAVAAAHPDADEKTANLMRLIEIVSEIEATSTATFHEVAAKLEWLHENLAVEPVPQSEVEDAKVKILTIHAAKGLEFDTVIVPLSSFPKYRPPLFDVSVGFYPQSDSPLAELVKRYLRITTIAEEKRILYTALTRAKNNLLIVYAESHVRDNPLIEKVCKILNTGKNLVVRQEINLFTDTTETDDPLAYFTKNTEKNTRNIPPPVPENIYEVLNNFTQRQNLRPAKTRRFTRIAWKGILSPLLMRPMRYALAAVLTGQNSVEKIISEITRIFSPPKNLITVLEDFIVHLIQRSLPKYSSVEIAPQIDINGESIPADCLGKNESGEEHIFFVINTAQQSPSEIRKLADYILWKKPSAKIRILYYSPFLEIFVEPRELS